MALTDNIISYWKLDEASGDAFDSTASGLTLTNTSATYGTGIINNGAVFTTTSTYLSAAHNALFNFGTGSFSVSFWAQLSSTTLAATENMIRHYNGGGWVIQFKSSNRQILFFAGTDNCPSTNNAIPNDTNWHHYAFVRNGTARKLYVDGVDVTGTDPGTAGNTDMSTTLYLSTSGSGENFTGTMDEVGLWSRSLSAGEVTSLYNGGNGFQYPFTAAATRLVPTRSMMGVGI